LDSDTIKVIAACLAILAVAWKAFVRGHYVVRWLPKRPESRQFVDISNEGYAIGKAVYLRVFVKGYGLGGWFSECSAWLDSVEYEGRVVSGPSEALEWMDWGGCGPRPIGAGAFASVFRVLEAQPRIVQPVTQRSMRGGDVWDKPGVYTFNVSARTKHGSRGAIGLTVRIPGTDFRDVQVITAKPRGLLRWW
jgi:hypothetical protein